MIPEKPLKVTQTLYDILINDRLDHFTASELQQSYLEKDKDINENQAKRMAYRQIIRLQKLGMLRKAVSIKVKSHIYHKTRIFYLHGLISKEKLIYVDSSPKKLLEKRLEKHQAELISCIAETEEYKNLFDSLPELQEQLQSKYLNSQESSSKLLGKIKAIKNILSNQYK